MPFSLDVFQTPFVLLNIQLPFETAFEEAVENLLPVHDLTVKTDHSNVVSEGQGVLQALTPLYLTKCKSERLLTNPSFTLGGTTYAVNVDLWMYIPYSGMSM